MSSQASDLILVGSTCLLGRQIVRRHLQKSDSRIHLITACSRLEHVCNTFKPMYGADKVNIVVYNDLTGELNDLDRLPRQAPIIFLSSLSTKSVTSWEDVKQIVEFNVSTLAVLAFQLFSSVSPACFVFAGSSWENAYLGENRSPCFNLYAATKSAFGELARYMATSTGTPITKINLFDNFGPGDTRKKIVDLVVGSILNEDSLDISPANQWLDLSPVEFQATLLIRYVDSILSGHVALPAVSISGHRIRLCDLITLVEKITKKKSRLNIGGRPYRPGEVMNPCNPYPSLCYEDVVLGSLEQSLRDAYSL